MKHKKKTTINKAALYEMLKKGGMLKRADRKSARALKLDEKANELRTGARDKRDRLIARADKNYQKAIDLRKRSLMMALGGLVRKYQNGGVEGDPPMTAEQLRAMRNALLVGSADEMPQAEDVVTAGQGSSTSVAMPTRGPGEPLEPIRDPEPERQPEPREDLEPLTPLGMRTIKRDDRKELQGSPSEMPKEYEDRFTSFTMDNSMRTEQRPRAKEVYNPETRQYEERPLEIEELADYLFRNQRKLKNLKYPTLEDAARKAEEILSRPNAGRL